MPDPVTWVAETSLLDANVFIALVVVEHEHHEVAEGWFLGQSEVLLCPTVEGALMRYLVRVGESATTAAEVLHRWREHTQVTFVADDQSYTVADWSGVSGYRHITDTHLVFLAHRIGTPSRHSCHTWGYVVAHLPHRPTESSTGSLESSLGCAAWSSRESSRKTVTPRPLWPVET